ncbi:WXG100 family type VII secretion target [Ornithinibacillus sp. 179-J 7C1 HS]|uniref:WXG100 family type VII secretion target n=1 Tax=Ornithinibacillus sp. 179-J 7C1 HS TaxID=3142384 RepID=UPI00399F038B
MALAHEGNTDLAFDTDALRKYGKQYGSIADDLRKMSDRLEKLLAELKGAGWTTPAGTAFHKMVNTNWRENIDKYADLLDTLQNILESAASKYDNLVENHIEKTKLN